MKSILGISAFYPNAITAPIRNGKVIVAAWEERLHIITAKEATKDLARARDSNFDQ